MENLNLHWIGGIWFLVGLGVVALFFVMGFLARIYRKAGPHEALLEQKGLYYAMWRQQIGEKRAVPAQRAVPALA